VKPNYNPCRHFYQKYKVEIDAQFKTMFDLKINDSPKYDYFIQHNTIRVGMSDKLTVFSHIKNMLEIVKISNIFEGREVVDVGVGFGGSYLPIKFGNPTKIIGVDPFEENIELARNLGYDECHMMGWEDYVFPNASVVFLRGNWLPDYEPFFKRLQEHNVCDVIIIQHLLPLDLINTYHYMYNDVTPETICRWSYNQVIDVAKMPSIGELIRLALTYQYGLVSKKSVYREGKNIYKKDEVERSQNQVKYILHFSKVEG